MNYRQNITVGSRKPSEGGRDTRWSVLGWIRGWLVAGWFSNKENGNPQTDSQDPEESDPDCEEPDTNDLVDAFSILEKDTRLEFQLPSHQRCACHLLNLVATTDATKAEANDTYKRLSRSSFAKCQGLWNKTGRSYTAAEFVQDQCQLQLIRPNQTRWNSTYMAIERLLRIIDDKGEVAIRNVCEEFRLKM